MKQGSEGVILVVNDDPSQLKLMSVLLAKAGFHPVAASGGSEALEVAARERPELIICAVSMPGVEGIELCRRLRADRGLQAVPVLLVSALRTDSASVVSGLRAGADDYLEAPYDPMKFIAKVSRLVERKRADEERDTFFDVSLDMLCVADFDGHFKHVNPAWTRTLGYSEEELLATPFIRFVHPDDRERTIEVTTRGGRGEECIAFENRYRCKDGSYRWLLWNSKPDVERRLVYAVAHDITGRKAAEQSLRDSNAQIADIFESITDAFFALDREWQFTYLNAEAERVLQRPNAGLIGKSIWDEFPEVVGTIFDEMYHRVANEGTPVKFVEFYQPLNIWFEVNAYPARDGISVYFRDVTARHQAEESFRRANQLAIREYERLLERLATLAQALGSARELSTVYRALCDFTILSAPSTALFITLYHHERSVREAVYFWTEGKEVSPSDLPPFPVGDGPAGRAIKTGEIVVCEDYEKASLNRPQVWIGTENRHVPRPALIAPMAIMGRVIGTVEIQNYVGNTYTVEHVTAMRMAANMAANAIENVRLIEQERASEEQLRQSQKMEAVGKLAGGVAHDFNNLLTAINGYSDLSLRRLSKEEPIYQNIEEIRKAGQRASGLTRQLLAFSRKQVLQPKVMDLNASVSDIVKMLERLIGEDIDVLLKLDVSLGKVSADPGQIEQVLMNLAVNARDAMPKGGKLTIETGNVQLDAEYAGRHVATQPGRYVMLAVTDTGAGMDEQTQARIFEPFFTTKEVGKGTGLGLSTVYGIVKQSGGNIWVYSEVGRGTTFKVYLPRVDAVAEETEDAVEQAASGAGMETVMLVEDEELVRSLTRLILEEGGYKVLVAADGHEALRISERHEGSIRLMLTDVVMPGMSGRELAERITPMRPETGVLYMSGYTDDAIVHHGVLEEGMEFLEKPFTPSGLLQKVRGVLDRTGERAA